MTTPEHREKRPLSGPNYVPRNGVTEVQRYLIHADFLPKGADDGDFGRQTHNAMVEFQKYAMKPERMKRNTGKIEKTDKVLNITEADGVCESATRDELIRWFQNNWIKPEPNLREGDFDNVGVQNSKGRKGDPDHIEGSYVYDLQEFLAAVNAYHGKIDGWFGAVTKKALKLYQEHAAQGKFIDEHGAAVQHPTEESLKGHVAGVGDVKTRAHLKTVVDNKLKVPYVSKLTDSVGQGGGNKPDDVKVVKKKLKDLGYPVKDESETMTPEDIKAIKFFQAFNMQIKHGLITVDGKIDKGGKTEAALFGKEAKRYEAPSKGNEKPIEASIKKKMDDALAGTDQKAKDAWTNVQKVWKEVSPYLPTSTRMESGYRSTDEQRIQLYKKYKGFETDISEKYGDTAYLQNLKESADKTLTETKRIELDKNIHTQICGAVSSREVALPGKSKHESGHAIDTQIAAVDDRVRSLLWYSIECANTHPITNVTKESNSCVHFEF